jgi:hypothetical protein
MSATPEIEANKVRATRCACGLLAVGPEGSCVLTTNGIVHGTEECRWYNDVEGQR